MNEFRKKELIDSKVSKLISAIRDKRNRISQSLPSSPCVEESFQSHTPTKTFYTSNYEHRFQAQKEIIKCQRGTISKQEQLIKQLQEEIIKQKKELLLLKNCQPNGRNKQNKNDSDSTDKSEIVHSRSSTPSKLPDVLQGMKQREEERRNRWQIMKEQKALKDKQRAEAEAQEEMENRRRVLEMKKQRHREEMEKKKAAEDRQIYEERLKDNSLACSKKFTLIVCFLRWHSIVKYNQEREESARKIINKHLLSIALTNWKIATQNQLSLKHTAAENFYRCTVIKRCLNGWHTYCQEMKMKDQSTIRIIQKEMMACAFRRWHIYCLKRQIEQEEKYQKARDIYLRSMYKHYFQLWREVPKLSYEKREKEKRIRDWHCSVQQILPDFQIQE